MKRIIIYLILINLMSFLIMGYDKRQAKKDAWRVREAKLFLFAFLGGALGMYVGMKKFHHKTKHFTFKVGIPLLFIVNAVMVYGLIKYIFYF